MATTGLQFAAAVDAWVRETERRMTAVFRESTQRVASEAQRNIPVDTGFARASIRASTSEMPKIDPSARPQKGASYGDNIGDVVTVIASAHLGQTIRIGWTASYVGVLESGSSKQAPQGFVRIAALQWQRIVDEVIAEAKNRSGGG